MPKKLKSPANTSYLIDPALADAERIANQRSVAAVQKLKTTDEILADQVRIFHDEPPNF